MIGKPIVTVFTAVIMALIGYLSDNVLDRIDLINAGLVLISALGVYIVPNLVGGVAKYSKMILAGLFAAGTLYLTVMAGGTTTAEWLEVLVAFLGAAGVVVPKAPQYGLVTPVVTSR